MKKFEVKTKKTIYQVVARDSQHAKQKVLHIANRPMKDEDSTSDGKIIVGKTYIDEQGKKWVCKSISMGGFMVSFDNVDPNDQEASRSIIGYTPDSLEETWGLKLADKKVKDGFIEIAPNCADIITHEDDKTMVVRWNDVIYENTQHIEVQLNLLKDLLEKARELESQGYKFQK